MVVADIDGSKICTLGPKFGVFEVGRVGDELPLETVTVVWLDVGEVPNASIASTT
jgi:hypothetical protein